MSCFTFVLVDMKKYLILKNHSGLPKENQIEVIHINVGSIVTKRFFSNFSLVQSSKRVFFFRLERFSIVNYQTDWNK